MNLYGDEVYFAWYSLNKLLLQTVKMNMYNTKYIEFEISIWAEKIT